MSVTQEAGISCLESEGVVAHIEGMKLTQKHL